MTEKRDWADTISRQNESFVAYYLNQVEIRSENPTFVDYEYMDRISDLIVGAFDIAINLQMWIECCRFGLSWCDPSKGYLCSRSRWHDLEIYIEKCICAAKSAGRKHDEISLTANLIIVQERLGKAVDYSTFHKMFEFYDSTGDKINAARAQIMIAEDQIRAGDISKARELLHEARVVLFEGNKWSDAVIAHNYLGLSAMVEGNYPLSEQYFQDGLLLAREHHIVSGEPHVIVYLAGLAVVRSNRAETDDGRKYYFNQMEDLFAEAIAQFKKLGEIGSIIDVYLLLSEKYQYRGLGARSLEERKDWYEKAERILFQSLALANDISYTAQRTVILSQLGINFVKSEEFERANLLLKECLTLNRELGRRRAAAVDMYWLGVNEQEFGRRCNDNAIQRKHYSNAANWYNEALVIAQEINDKFVILKVRAQQGALLGDNNDLHAAEQMLVPCINEMRDEKYFSDLSECLVSMASVMEKAGRLQEALELLEEVIGELSAKDQVDLLTANNDRLRVMRMIDNKI